MNAKQGAMRTAAALGVVALLYVLSIGPVEIYAARHPPFAFNERFAAIYMPIMWACDNVPGVRSFLEWYVSHLYDFLYPPGS
jgi:hypothetical protein